MCLTILRDSYLKDNAKVSIGTKKSDTRILGIPRDTTKDETSINFEKMTKDVNSTVATKRNITFNINNVFDILGLVSPAVMYSWKVDIQ